MESNAMKFKQSGMATLLISIVLLLTLSIGGLYANRALFLEQKSNNNVFNNTQARFAANSGLQLFIANFQAKISTPSSIAWLDNAANNYAPLASKTLGIDATTKDIDISQLKLAHTNTMNGVVPNPISTCTPATGLERTAVLCGKSDKESEYFVGVALVKSTTMPGGVTRHTIRVASVGQSDGGLAQSIIYRDINYDVKLGAGGTSPGAFVAVNGTYNVPSWGASLGVNIGVSCIGVCAPPTKTEQGALAATDQFGLIKQNFADFAADPSKGISVGEQINQVSANSVTPMSPENAKSSSCNGLFYGYPGKEACNANVAASIIGKQSNETFFTQYFGDNKAKFIESNFTTPPATNKAQSTSIDNKTTVINCTTGCTYTPKEFEALMATNNDKSVIIDGNLTITAGVSDGRTIQDAFLYVSGQVTNDSVSTFNGVLAVEGNFNNNGSFNVNPSFTAYKKSRSKMPTTSPSIKYFNATAWRDFQNSAL
jgi:hypothetical protein